MTLQIKTNDWRDWELFQITGISYSIEYGRPIDIVIYGSRPVLQTICDEYSCIGYNMQELDPIVSSINSIMYYKGASHEALIARLPDFEVLDYNEATYM